MVYHVSNQVEVTVRDINQLGDVLDKAVAAGANNIYGVNFSVEDTAKLEADARAKAVADAKSRAESLAQTQWLAVGRSGQRQRSDRQLRRVPDGLVAPKAWAVVALRCSPANWK